MSRYRRHEFIGQGTSGIVYRATDVLANDEVVAVKVIPNDKGFPKDELTLGRRITHPNVIRIFDYYSDKKASHCLAREYAPTDNLRTGIDKTSPAWWEKWEPIAIDMLKG